MSNLGKQIRDVTIDNPMLIEIQRFRRKYLSRNAPGTPATLLFTTAYGTLLLLQVRFPRSVTTVGVMMISLCVLCLLAPAFLHGAIAGERERRSWEFLLVAPISKAQLVFGKFFGAAFGILIVATLFTFPIIVARLGDSYAFADFLSVTEPFPPYETQVNIPIAGLILQYGVVVSFALLVAALSLFFSARSRRPLMALSSTLGTLIILLLVIPVLAGAPEGVAKLGYVYHPFFTLFEMEPAANRYYSGVRWLWGWPQLLLYLGLTILLLIWTERTVTFADNEVGFLKRGKSHA